MRLTSVKISSFIYDDSLLSLYPLSDWNQIEIIENNFYAVKTDIRTGSDGIYKKPKITKHICSFISITGNRQRLQISKPEWNSILLKQIDNQ